MLKRFLCLFVGALAGCSPDNHGSLHVHYEDMDTRLAEELAASKPQATAEFGVTNSVVVSAELVRDDKYARVDLAETILQTGSNLIVMTGPQDNAITAPVFTRLRGVAAVFPGQILFKSLTGLPTAWARDWAPIEAINQKNRPIMLDFNYYDYSPADDSSPAVLVKALPNGARLSVPVYTEGGNFMINTRGDCFMTSHVLEENSAPAQTYYLDSSGNVLLKAHSEEPIETLEEAHTMDPHSKPIQGWIYNDALGAHRVRTDNLLLDQAQVTDYFQRYAGCKTVNILPRMPVEGTGHIDMFAKLLSDDTIMVNTISNEQINGATFAQEKAAATKMQAYLITLRQTLTKLGYKIVEVPMPLAQYRRSSDDAHHIDRFVVRSYTNSLIINHGGVMTAIVPQYKAAVLAGGEASASGSSVISQPYSDDSSLAGYETAVRAAYQQAGFKVVFVNSDNLINDDGAVHCTTMQFSSVLQ